MRWFTLWRGQGLIGCTSLACMANIALGFALLAGGDAERGDDDVEVPPPAAPPVEPPPALPDLREGFLQLLAARPGRHSGNLLPKGVAHRSGAHALLMRAAKERHVAERRLQQATSSATALAKAWDGEHGLRLGDNIELDVRSDRGLNIVGGEQPNQWTHHGLLKVAWKEVGRAYSVHGRGTSGVGATRAHGDALLMLASSLTIAERAALNAWLGRLDPAGALHISRHYDPTQFMLKFGKYHEALQPFARFLVPDLARPGRYKSVAWTEFSKAFPRANPGKGLVF